MSRHFRSGLIGLLAVVSLGAGTIHADTVRPYRALQPQTVAEIDAAARDVVSSGKIAGLAIGVVRNGQVVLNRGYGTANLEQGTLVNKSSVFRIASVSKQFTAAATLLLAERGKLSLEDKLSRFFPDFPRGNEVTVRQLLNHTSGIHSFTNPLPDTINRVGVVVAEFHKHIASLGYDFEPGTMFSYNNSGYYLLGLIIEQASGQSYRDFLRTHIFDKIGMLDTAADDAADVVPMRAAGYELKEAASGKFINAKHVDMTVPYSAGAIRSTVADLARWSAALFGGEVLNAKSLKEMTTPARLRNGQLVNTAVYSGEPGKPAVPPPPLMPGTTRDDYALGVAIGSLDGHPSVSHNGGIEGFRSRLAYYGDDGLAVILLTNTVSSSPDDPIRGLMTSVPRAVFKEGK